MLDESTFFRGMTPIWEQHSMASYIATEPTTAGSVQSIGLVAPVKQRCCTCCKPSSMHHQNVAWVFLLVPSSAFFFRYLVLVVWFDLFDFTTLYIFQQEQAVLTGFVVSLKHMFL